MLHKLLLLLLQLQGCAALHEQLPLLLLILPPHTPRLAAAARVLTWL